MESAGGCGIFARKGLRARYERHCCIAGRKADNQMAHPRPEFQNTSHEGVI
jgi:hypothetical protein